MEHDQFNLMVTQCLFLFAAQEGHSRSSRVKHRLKMKETYDFERPERDLFIFAVLFNRRQLADLFLHQGTDHLGE